jgi:chitinase
MSFSVYITYWDNNLLTQVQDMIDHGVIQQNTRVILAFASFNFISTKYIPGFGSVTMDDVKNIVNLVHSSNAKISLSIGGATYPLASSDLYGYPGELAENINGVLNLCGFDGVDFDIEDNSSSVPTNFAETASSIINTLRSLNSELYITLTTPGQAWAEGMYQQSLLNMTIGNIDAWQPMEYDLWLEPTEDSYNLTDAYTNQIQSDIKYYKTTWSVPSNKIILGLMCGQDDVNHVMTLQDALNLTDFARSEGLKGMMMWDANIDGKGCAGNAPYAYSMGVQALL